MKNETNIINICDSEEKVDETKPINIIVSSDGLMEWRKKGPLEFIMPIKQVPLQKSTSFKGVKLEQKIPSSLLLQILTFFQAVYNKYKTEAGAVIMYNKKTKEYFVHIPDLCLSSASAKWERTYISDPPENCVSIMELHSHPWGSNPSPSNIDNNDELNLFGLFAVTGSIDSLVKIRATNRGSQIQIPLADVFDSSFPQEWMDKIDKQMISQSEKNILSNFSLENLNQSTKKIKNKKKKKHPYIYSELESVESLNHPTDIGFEDEYTNIFDDEDTTNDFPYLTDPIYTYENRIDWFLKDIKDDLYDDPQKLNEILELVKMWREEDKSENKT